MIQDSGTRREFESGAVRDIQEGKGRCDLLPLDVVCKLIHSDYLTGDDILRFIGEYMETGEINNIYNAIYAFINEYDKNFDGDIYTAILEVAKHYEEGCNKYGERNWQKGIPAHCYVDSGVRHYLKHLRGDTDERHDRAFIWNMLGLIWTVTHKPDLIDLPFNEAPKSLCVSAEEMNKSVNKLAKVLHG